jgi:peptidoglycan hydrolase CwlO-like protein
MGRQVKFNLSGNNVEVSYGDFGFLEIQQVARKIEHANKKASRFQRKVDILSNSLGLKSNIDDTLTEFEKIETEIVKLETEISKTDDDTTFHMNSLITDFVREIKINGRVLSDADRLNIDLSLKMLIFRNAMSTSEIGDLENFQATSVTY